MLRGFRWSFNAVHCFLVAKGSVHIIDFDVFLRFVILLIRTTVG